MVRYFEILYWNDTLIILKSKISERFSNPNEYSNCVLWFYSNYVFIISWTIDITFLVFSALNLNHITLVY